MNKQLIYRLALAFCLVMISYVSLSACTSFMMETDQGQFFVHSLNQGSIKSLPGMIFINQRNSQKTGYSWENLIQVTKELAPDLAWRSEYGSVTFNPFGKELPDGGMNEAGVFIWEMGFDTEYPSDQNRPTLFQSQWMQYVLDNCGTVAEVIE